MPVVIVAACTGSAEPASDSSPSDPGTRASAAPTTSAPTGPTSAESPGSSAHLGLWFLSDFHDGNERVELGSGVRSSEEHPSTSAWIEFHADGSLTGGGPCAGFTGTWTRSADGAALTETSGELSACHEDERTANRVGDAIFEVLTSPDALVEGSIADDRPALTLAAPSTGYRLVYRPASDDG